MSGKPADAAQDRAEALGGAGLAGAMAPPWAVNLDVAKQSLESIKKWALLAAVWDFTFFRPAVK